MDIVQHIDYWREGAREDLEAAVVLLAQNKTRHALFFAHAALEKLLKAHVVGTTRDLPPRIHDLLKLAALAGLALGRERREFLAGFQRHRLEGRYPDRPPASAPSRDEAEAGLDAAKETFAWLMSLLK